MKLIIDLAQDSDNTYPGHLIMHDPTDSDFVFFELESPERRIAVEKNDLLRLLRVIV